MYASNERRLPSGLHICEKCGQAKGASKLRETDGEVIEITSICLCEGFLCVECGQRLRRRPCTDYYDIRDGSWTHVPYFMGYTRRCKGCHKRAEARGDNPFGS